MSFLFNLPFYLNYNIGIGGRRSALYVVRYRFRCTSFATVSEHAQACYLHLAHVSAFTVTWI